MYGKIKNVTWDNKLKRFNIVNNKVVQSALFEPIVVSTGSAQKSKKGAKNVKGENSEKAKKVEKRKRRNPEVA